MLCMRMACARLSWLLSWSCCGSTPDILEMDSASSGCACSNCSIDMSANGPPKARVIHAEQSIRALLYEARKYLQNVLSDHAQPLQPRSMAILEDRDRNPVM